MLRAGEDLGELEEKTDELVRLSARFHALGRQLSEKEKQQFAATFLQAVVRGFLARILKRNGAYLLRIYIKTLRHDPAEHVGADSDAYEPEDVAHTVKSTQRVGDFLAVVTKGMQGPVGAYDGRFELCRSPKHVRHVHLTWGKCRRLAAKSPVWADRSWDENGIADNDQLTMFWHWRH